MNFCSDEFLLGEELSELAAAVTLVLDDLTGLLGRPGRELRDLGARTVEPDLVGLDARVRQGQRGEGLLLRRHDALERRVARLVDLLDAGGRVRRSIFTVPLPTSTLRANVSCE